MNKVRVAIQEVRISLVEYLGSSGRWFLAIVVGLILAAFGVVDIVLKAFNVDWVVPRWVWVASLIVSLTASPFMVFHRARVRRDNYRSILEEMQNAHPNIRVESHIVQDWLLLKVTNLGPEAAVFSARVIRITGVEMGQAGQLGYDLGWHLVPSEPKDRELKKDEPGFLEIAKTGEVALEGNEEMGEIDFRTVNGKVVRTAHLRLEGECTCTVQVFANPSLSRTEIHSYILSLERRTKSENPQWRVQTLAP